MNSGNAGAITIFFSEGLQGLLRHGPKNDPVAYRLEPKTKKYFNIFKHCPDCDHIYWRGSHCDAMAAKFESLGLGTD